MLCAPALHHVRKRHLSFLKTRSCSLTAAVSLHRNLDVYPKAISRMLDCETDWFEHKKFGRAFPIGRMRVRTDRHS